MLVFSLVCLASLIPLSSGQSTDVYEGLPLKVELDSLRETEGIVPVLDTPIAIEARQGKHNHRVIQGVSLVLLGTILSTIVLIVWYYGRSSKPTARDAEIAPLGEIQVHVASRTESAEVGDLVAEMCLRGDSGRAKERSDGEKMCVDVALKSVSEPLRITRPISEITVVRRSTGDVVGLQSSEHRRKTRRKCFTCY